MNLKGQCREIFDTAGKAAGVNDSGGQQRQQYQIATSYR
jgi:hypothetical protein